MKPSPGSWLLLGVAVTLSCIGVRQVAQLTIALPLLLAAGGFAIASLLKSDGHRGFLALLLLLGAGVQIPLVLRAPESSDDVYRYLWEGRVQVAGESPYRFPPESPRLQHLRDAEIHPRINHPEIATIYPPVAEGLFALGHLLGGDPVAWKTLLLVLELGAAGFVAFLATRRGVSAEPAVLFLWNPLLVLEAGEGGHVDAAGGALLLTAVMLAAGSGRTARAFASGLAALSVLIKPAALPALPFFVRHRAGLVGMAAGAVLAVALVTPLFFEEPGRLAAFPSGRATLLTRQGRTEVAAPRWEATGREEIRVRDPSGEHRALPESGGRAVLVARPTDEGGLALIAARASLLEVLRDPSRDAGDLVGRYALGVLGAGPDEPWGFLVFDGRQHVAVIAPDGRRERLLYNAQEDGSFCLWDEAERLSLRATLRLSNDRSVLRAVIADWPGWGQGVEAVAVRAQDGPLTGGRQYGGRWAGFALLFPRLEAWLGSRFHAAAVGGLMLLLLVAVLWWRAVPLAAATTVTTALAVALLPVVYPWYALWVLGPASSIAGTRWRRGVAALLAAAPLIHLA